MKRGIHSVLLLHLNWRKMLLIKSQSRVPSMNCLIDLLKHVIKGLINLSKARRVSINIFNYPHNRLNEGENIFASANKLQKLKS